MGGLPALTRRGLDRLVAAIGVQLPRIAGVVQVSDQALINQTLAQGGIGHRPSQLDPAEHVAVHPVGTRQIKRLLLPIVEVEDARMLEKASDHRTDANVVGLRLKLGGQHTRAAHDQIDLHALLAGRDQRAYQAGVGQRIHLGHQPRRTPCRGGLAELADTINHRAVQTMGGEQQGLHLGQPALTGQVVEDMLHIEGELRIGRQITHVGVKAGGTGVVVAC